MATDTLNTRIAAGDKERFTRTAEALGLTPSAAVSVFVKKFNEYGGFPFDVRLSAEPFLTETEACDFADSFAKEMISDEG